MNAKIKTDLIDVLGRTIRILKKKGYNADELKKVSDRTIHDASVFQDEDSVSMAVLIYSLSKIVQRQGIVGEKVITKLEEIKSLLKAESFEQYRRSVKQALQEISRIDAKMRVYIEQVIHHAKINKGSKLFYHGISLARVSEMLGVSHWELMRYIGHTTFTDGDVITEKVKRRMDYAKEIFNIKAK